MADNDDQGSVAINIEEDDNAEDKEEEKDEEEESDDNSREEPDLERVGSARSSKSAKSANSVTFSTAESEKPLVDEKKEKKPNCIVRIISGEGTYLINELIIKKDFF